jgi:hypothetical protein
MPNGFECLIEAIQLADGLFAKTCFLRKLPYGTYCPWQTFAFDQSVVLKQALGEIA